MTYFMYEVSNEFGHAKKVKKCDTDSESVLFKLEHPDAISDNTNNLFILIMHKAPIKKIEKWLKKIKYVRVNHMVQKTWMDLTIKSTWDNKKTYRYKDQYFPEGRAISIKHIEDLTNGDCTFLIETLNFKLACKISLEFNGYIGLYHNQEINWE